MKGRIDIRVSNNRARFRFNLERNITIVRGDSGTGKSTLYDMVAEYTRLGEDSGVQVSAPCPCVALTDMDWRNQLRHTSGSWTDQAAIDAHHASPMMSAIAALREKYDLHMTVERFVSIEDNVEDERFIRR